MPMAPGLREELANSRGIGPVGIWAINGKFK